MTQEMAMAEQARLAEHFDLGHWFGTGCDKCCGVFPRFHSSDGFDSKCWFECDVCGKRTERFSMPWQAKEAWNAGLVIEEECHQITWG